MALPTFDNECTLNILYLGGPFVQVASKSTIDLNTLDVIDLGGPFWGLSPTEQTPTDNTIFFGINF